MRRAKYVQMHDVLHVPGAGSLPNTLPPSNKTLANLELYLLDGGQVLMQWGPDKDKPNEFVIAAGNIKGTLLAAEDKKPVVKETKPKA